MSDLTLPHDLTEREREAIVAHFKALPEAAQTKSRIFELGLPGRPLFLIKHGSDALTEAYTQYFFYCLPRSDPLAPLIPRVFDAFSSAEGFCFFVMQKIDAPTLKASGIAKEEAVGHAASAVKWLLDQTPFVPASVFGRISLGNAPVWHQFFKEHRAPRAFDDASMLLTYVKRAFRRCRPMAQPNPTVMAQLETSFTARSICHSDINAENFLLDSDKKVWLIDFQHVSVLPPVFLTYAFFNTGEKFASDIGKRLEHHPSDAANAMVSASSMLQQTGGNAELGL